jgi:CRISPR-associated protein Cas5t
LSFVGEEDRSRHRGARVTAGIIVRPELSVVFRTFWQIKSAATPQGTGENLGPDLQELMCNSELVLWCDSTEETGNAPTLEQRIRSAFTEPGKVARFGGWSLGESTHLVNDAWLLEADASLQATNFVLDPKGDATLPVWVDHVGMSGTRYAVGRLSVMRAAPSRESIPQIID